MQVYNYNGTTGAYLSEAEAIQSPLDPPVTYLIPANATEIAPPTAGANQVAVFANGSWSLQPNWIGVSLYLTATGAPVEATAIGQTPTSLNATETAPPDATSTWSGTAWVESQTLVAAALASAQTAAINSIIGQTNSLTSQFTSNYPQFSIDSWTAQLAEARIVNAGQTPPAPSILQAIVTAANNPAVTLQTVATSVVSTATAYQDVVALAQTTVTNAQTSINAATLASQIPGIVSTIQTTLTTQAQALGLTLPA